MQRRLLWLCLLGIPCASVAQSGQSSWTNLNGLRAGETIQIVEMNSKKLTGVFESVSDSAISIKDASGDVSVQKQDVRSVKLMKNTHRLRNTLVFGGVGAGGGAIVGAFVGKSNSKGFNIISTGDVAAIGALGGGLIGSIVGALLPSHTTVYAVSAR